MVGCLVLEIPEFAYLLQQETILEWQLYATDKKGGYRKVRWGMKGTGNNVEITGAESEKARVYAEIDFAERKLIFCQGEASDGEFTKFLQYLLGRTYLQVQPGLMHFIADSKNRPRKACQEER